jgi:hypothetical protein
MPLIPPETVSRHESMMKRLAEHANSKASLSQSPGPPPEVTLRAGGDVRQGSAPAHSVVPRPALEWTQVSPTVMKTTDGRYSFIKITVMGTDFFELWRILPARELLETRMNSFAKAKKLAQKDADDHA